MKRVAIVYSHPSSFILRDIDLLRRHFTVDPVHWKGKRSVPRLAAAVARSQSVLSWFALDHAFVAAAFARVLRKRHFVVLGGVDCAAVPALDYGIFLRPLKRHFAVGAVRGSVLALPVQEHLARDFLANSGLDSIRYQVVPTGYDSRFFSPSGAKERVVLTVGPLTDRTTIRRKGLDVFAHAATMLDGARFLVVGQWATPFRSWLSDLSSGHVEFLGRVSDRELLDHYRRAAVYCQLSRYEGLPNALCEAMLCECVPVGTRIPGIVEAIGDTGPLCDVGDAKSAALAIGLALHRDGSDARRRVIDRYPLQRREASLVRLLGQ